MKETPRVSSSGIVFDERYDAEGATFDVENDLGKPGTYPFTRGIHPRMYRDRPWTRRQYAGFGSAAETNERFVALLAQGQTGLSVAFDLPTQMGRDPDHPLAQGEVGRTGVSIASLEDMRQLLHGLPLGEVTTSMTINATAAILLCLYIAVAEEQGIPPSKLKGTVQNDILKEYIARGTYIYQPRPSMRLFTDLLGYCAKELPEWNTVSVSGYHMREAGADAVQEVAFTLANGLAYVDAGLAAGLDLDAFLPRISFFFAAHNHLIEEVAKFRAARRLWARLLTERHQVASSRSRMLRFHVQTGGSTLTAQQPLVNVVRTTVQALAAVLGGAQSLHTNAFDEALGLPTPASAMLALRTQQVLISESGLGDIVDPLGGSYAVEALTSEIEARARQEIDRIDALGGAVAAVERGFQQKEIERRAYEHQRAVEAGERQVVGVNVHVSNEPANVPIFRIDPKQETSRRQAVAQLRGRRNHAEVSTRLERLEKAARGSENVMPFILDAVRGLATLGEISDRLRSAFGNPT